MYFRGRIHINMCMALAGDAEEQQKEERNFIYDWQEKSAGYQYSSRWVARLQTCRKDRSDRRYISVLTPINAELLQFAFDVNREIVRVGTMIISHLLMIKCILHKTRTWVIRLKVISVFRRRRILLPSWMKSGFEISLIWFLET